MKIEFLKFKKIFAAGAILFCLCFAASDVMAQTKKRKTRRKTHPVVILTPLPQQRIDPEIVSRADDAQNENPIAAAQTEATAPENIDDKINRANSGIKDLKTRVKSLELTKTNEYDEKQKRLMLNLDILTRAETRAENLRKQLFDMIEKENTVKTRLEQLENDTRPEMIDRSVAFAGTLRPEELRDLRKKNLDSEKSNLQNLLTEIQNSRASLNTNVQKADAMVEKMRFVLEKDIDDALNEQPKN